eukprot:366454-Chlamydomonas_euryale.AAC.10
MPGTPRLPKTTAVVRRGMQRDLHTHTRRSAAERARLTNHLQLLHALPLRLKRLRAVAGGGGYGVACRMQRVRYGGVHAARTAHVAGCPSSAACDATPVRACTTTMQQARASPVEVLDQAR